MVLLIVFACLLLIGLIPLGVIAQYGQEGARVWVVIGPYRFLAFPGERKTKKKRPGKSSDKSGFESRAQVRNNRRDIRDFLPLVRVILDFLTDFRCKLRVNDLRLNVILAGDDPYNLSLNYGRAWAVVGNVIPLLERYFKIKKRELEIECDYLADSTSISGYVHLTITIGRVLSISVFHGIKLLRKYFKITRNAKDGAIL